MKKTIVKINSIAILLIVLFLTSNCKKSDDSTPTPNSTPNPTTVTDIDGNIYHTVIIGTQTWMLENLKVTKYLDGTAIPNITDNTVWFNLTNGAYCNYNNNANTAITYGRLYNWFAVNDSRKIAPSGWHVPTNAEWSTLINYLGGENIAGGKLKEAGIIHWNNPNTAATNEVGFTALPAGGRYLDGVFDYLGINGSWWTSSEGSGTTSFSRDMSYDGSYVDTDNGSKVAGFSIRCIKD